MIASDFIQVISEQEERSDRSWESGLHSVKKVEKPWGYELIWARTPIYGGKIVHIKANHQVSLQCHVNKDETICIFSGFAKLLVEDDSGRMVTIDLKPGQSYRIIPKRKHRLIATEDSDILEATSAHYDDIVRIQDDYDRIEK
jgi:mannose-6-phosphate isomerase